MSKTLREHIEWQEELGREIGRGIVFTQYLAMCAQKEDYALPAPMNFDHKWVMEKVKKKMVRSSASTPTSMQGEFHPPLHP